MARQERGTRSRRSILKAAAQVFDERGYEAASTTEILTRTGLTRGALYHHFPSKEALAAALVAAQSEALVPPDQPVKLQATIDLTMEFAHRLQHDSILRASVRLVLERTSFSCPAQTPYDQASAAILGLLSQAEQQGELLPGVDIHEAASVIVGAFTGLQVVSQVYSNRQDLPERISALWRYLLPGIAVAGIIGALRIVPRDPSPESQPENPGARMIPQGPAAHRTATPCVRSLLTPPGEKEETQRSPDPTGSPITSPMPPA
ncbi:ScbR family autoregulator-binding transcription factor [Streptomyces sp. CNQ085]|uniref:ScbR family autoregulator-binding transcription factor n=1 Tax=Streptomyces sp. CNQ085 TaxID=2886944 RepID=UPI001F508EB6|nr:ScbR family autoregulator-binding transcription factor [Streptomyces sp. CNQ085]MCI0385807.1 TetR/AcrR family transcriptional regulator [Streptomyces sp. CNQ085]